MCAAAHPAGVPSDAGGLARVRVLLTGAGGFLGWHTRLRLRALTDHDVIPVTRESWDGLGDALHDADAVIHVAGVNRGEDDEVEEQAAEAAAEVEAGAREAAVESPDVVDDATIDGQDAVEAPADAPADDTEE